MIGLKPLIVFAVVSLCGVVLGNEDGELKAVIVLFRHGDRSPLSSWPNDEYFGDSSLWPDGYGALNNMGKQRHYRLGQWFRERYDGFLPARYNSSDIYVRSTDVDRTLMSAASNLAGLYPPVDDQVWNENIPWQSIPIHTVQVLKDHHLVNAISCPKHDRLVKELLNSDEFTQFLDQYTQLFQNISEVTGYPADNMTLDNFAVLYAGITIYKGLNLTLPKWTEIYWPDIQALAVKKYQVPTYTKELAKLESGKFFDYILDHLKAIQNETDVTSMDTLPPKFLMLSSHETIISDVTNFMGCFTGAVPEFASTVIWEVKSRNGNNGELYLNLYFKNSTHFSPLLVSGCDFNCELNRFVKIIESNTITVDQWMLECNGE